MGGGLKLSGISKRYGDLLAVDSADLEVTAGTIHAVCGENGAGKSTLLKVAAGLVVPDAGSVFVEGVEVAPITPRQAIARGVGMVVQHFSLIPALTVAENIVLGSEPAGPFGTLALGQAKERIRTIASELAADLPLGAITGDLGVGQKQRIEIVRCLYRDARVIVLDEPTAVLTKGEAEALYRTLRHLADAGKTVVVVTHKLDEVRLYCDAATVMRKGKVINTYAINDSNRDGITDAITKSIMGDGTSHALHTKVEPTGKCISVSEVSLGRSLHQLSFDVAPGEVVGIAGVEGNGQRELVDLLSGLVECESGRVLINDEALGREPRAKRVATVFEDRQTEGLVLDASIANNVLLGDFARFSSYGWLREREMRHEADARLQAVGAPMRLDEPVRTLSGGNQQKVVVARALAQIERGAKVLLLSHPTRGVDLLARSAIWDLVRGVAEKNVAVVLISSDLDELRALSDRILVLSRGRIAKSFAPNVSDDEIGHAMLALGEAHS